MQAHNSALEQKDPYNAQSPSPTTRKSKQAQPARGSPSAKCQMKSQARSDLIGRSARVDSGHFRQGSQHQLNQIGFSRQFKRNIQLPITRPKLTRTPQTDSTRNSHIESVIRRRRRTNPEQKYSPASQAENRLTTRAMPQQIRAGISGVLSLIFRRSGPRSRISRQPRIRETMPPASRPKKTSHCRRRHPKPLNCSDPAKNTPELSLGRRFSASSKTSQPPLNKTR